MISDKELQLFRIDRATATEYVIRKNQRRVDILTFQRFMLATSKDTPPAVFAVDDEFGYVVGVAKSQLTTAFSRKMKIALDAFIASMPYSMVIERINSIRSKIGLKLVPRMESLGMDPDSDMYSHLFPRYRHSTRTHCFSDVIPLQVLPLVLVRCNKRPFCTDTHASFNIFVLMLRQAIANLPQTLARDEERNLMLQEYDMFSSDKYLWGKFSPSAVISQAGNGPLSPILADDCADNEVYDDCDELGLDPGDFSSDIDVTLCTSDTTASAAATTTTTATAISSSSSEVDDDDAAFAYGGGTLADCTPGPLVAKYKTFTKDNAMRMIANIVLDKRRSVGASISYNHAKPWALELVRLANIKYNMRIVARQVKGIEEDTQPPQRKRRVKPAEPGEFDLLE